MTTRKALALWFALGIAGVALVFWVETPRWQLSFDGKPCGTEAWWRPTLVFPGFTDADRARSWDWKDFRRGSKANHTVRARLSNGECELEIEASLGAIWRTFYRCRSYSWLPLTKPWTPSHSMPNVEIGHDILITHEGTRTSWAPRGEPGVTEIMGAE